MIGRTVGVASATAARYVRSRLSMGGEGASAVRWAIAQRARRGEAALRRALVAHGEWLVAASAIFAGFGTIGGLHYLNQRRRRRQFLRTGDVPRAYLPSKT